MRHPARPKRTGAHQARGAPVGLIHKRYFCHAVLSKEVNDILLRGGVRPARQSCHNIRIGSSSLLVRPQARWQANRSPCTRSMSYAHSPLSFSTRLSSVRLGCCCLGDGKFNAASDWSALGAAGSFVLPSCSMVVFHLNRGLRPEIST